MYRVKKREFVWRLWGKKKRHRGGNVAKALGGGGINRVAMQQGTLQQRGDRQKDSFRPNLPNGIAWADSKKKSSRKNTTEEGRREREEVRFRARSQFETYERFRNHRGHTFLLRMMGKDQSRKNRTIKRRGWQLRTHKQLSERHIISER